jgi:flagellar biogenesis protein FliO
LDTLILATSDYVNKDTANPIGGLILIILIICFLSWLFGK